MRRNAVVYLIRFANGKMYVGQTVCLKRRLGAHLRGRFPVSSAMGCHSWFVEILAVSDDSTEIDCIERAAISAFNSLAPNGYNIETGGKTGYASPAVVASNRRRVGESRPSAGDHLRGKPRSAETRARISASQKGRPFTGPEHHTDETKQKIGEANRRRVWSEESRAKMSAVHKGRKRPPRSDQARHNARIAAIIRFAKRRGEIDLWA